MATQDEIKFLSNPNIGQKKTKYCRFKRFGLKYIDYKDIEILKKFLNPNGKIMAHKRTGVTAKNQRELSSAVKHARFLGLLPFVAK